MDLFISQFDPAFQWTSVSPSLPRPDITYIHAQVQLVIFECITAGEDRIRFWKDLAFLNEHLKGYADNDLRIISSVCSLLLFFFNSENGDYLTYCRFASQFLVCGTSAAFSICDNNPFQHFLSGASSVISARSLLECSLIGFQISARSLLNTIG